MSDYNERTSNEDSRDQYRKDEVSEKFPRREDDNLQERVEELIQGPPPAPTEELSPSESGIPIEDDNVRKDLYDIERDTPPDEKRQKFGDYFNQLPKKEQDAIRLSGEVGDGTTTIRDVKGNEKIIVVDDREE